jgi:hypothetical protein
LRAVKSWRLFRGDQPVDQVAIRFLNLYEKETHIAPGSPFRIRHIGPHDLAGQYDFPAVGRFNDDPADFIRFQGFSAPNEYAVYGDVTGFSFDGTLPGDQGDRPIHLDSCKASLFLYTVQKRILLKPALFSSSFLFPSSARGISVI